MDIGIKGYQSIKKAVLKVEPGQIVGVVGLNNYGKSAIIRAIRAFIVNASDKEVINTEIGAVKVAIRTERGLFIWEKSEKAVAYTKNDKKELKLNKAALDEVFPGSGFVVEKEDGTFLVPSIVPENETIFPFSLTPSVAFRIFSRFMAPPKIGAVVKDLKDKIKEDRSSIVGVRGAIDAYETEISRNSTERELLPTKEAISAIREKAEKVQVAKVRLARVETDLDRMDKETDDINRKRGSRDFIAIKGLNEKLVSFKKLVSEVEKLSQLLARGVDYEKRVLGFEVRETALKEFLNSHKARVIKIGEMKKSIAEFSSLENDWRMVMASLGIQMDTWKQSKKKLGKFKACPLCRREFI